MFQNDQLTRGERIRLESLSQSIHVTNLIATKQPTLGTILENAEAIERWLKLAREDA